MGWGESEGDGGGRDEREGCTWVPTQKNVHISATVHGGALGAPPLPLPVPLPIIVFFPIGVQTQPVGVHFVVRLHRCVQPHYPPPRSSGGRPRTQSHPAEKNMKNSTPRGEKRKTPPQSEKSLKNSETLGRGNRETSRVTAFKAMPKTTQCAEGLHPFVQHCDQCDTANARC